MVKPPLPTISPKIPLEEIVNGIENFGVYVTDRDRRIIYWNRAAERIMGYPPCEVIGRGCFDRVLCHIDRHGRELCDTTLCPLHNSIISDQSHSLQSFVFGKHKNGTRVPLAVSVSPVRNEQGEIIGGIEVFRDGSFEFHQLQLAQAVQRKMMPVAAEIGEAWPVAWEWIPAEMVGGDLIIMFPIQGNRLSGVLTDVSGHGVASALATSFIWKMVTETRTQGFSPQALLSHLAESWSSLNIESHYFSAQAFIFDPAEQSLTISSAGHPLPLLVDRSNQSLSFVEILGDLIGLFDHPHFNEVKISLHGKRLFFYSDGLVETQDPHGRLLGDKGFCDWAGSTNNLPLREVPGKLTRRVLNFSGTPEPRDDLTLIVLEGNGF